MAILVCLLLLTGAVLYGVPSASIPYVVLVVLHAVGGVLTMAAFAARLMRLLRGRPLVSQVGWAFTLAGGLIGVALVWTGTSQPFRSWLLAHIALNTAGAAFLAAGWAGGRGWLGASRVAAVARVAAALAMITVIGVALHYTREVRWQRSYRIDNPHMPPGTMDEEGQGPQGPFFPSATRTRDDRLVPARFFMQSDSCRRCHADIYAQWDSSAHHFSSFNNQWYRKSIEYMQDVVGTRPSKWCGGCHDPAVLFSGLMDTPAREIMDRPEMHTGLGCVGCHAIDRVDSTMGQGGYRVDYPPLAELAASEQPILRSLHDAVVRLNPEPHRRTFLKPFVRNQTADFCSTCHKVHLDVPVNAYRWIRGFNDYDNWQASGVSGQGARSFYYPDKPQKCIDCHMPLVPSQDAGSHDGLVHSHRFPGANTALPFVNHDREQLEATERFLEDGIISVDIFALARTGHADTSQPVPRSDLSTTFAVGEEADVPVAPAGIDAVPVTAPLDRVDAVVRRGESVRVDVVVRTRKVGHFFPGGTVDAFDVWVELKAIDDTGRVLFWSGMVEDEGRGPVEKGAHFYRSLLIDGEGNPILKRNAWASRSVVYVRLIPPGAADTVHYRLVVPETAGDRIRLEAKVHYRKFAWWNTQFAYAGVPLAGSVDANHDSRPWVFTGDVTQVSGRMKAIPDLPIVTLADDTVDLRVLPHAAAEPEPRVALAADDWTRWNDHGIGLLLQGDLRGAEAAFRRVTEIDPRNPDGWVNIGRVRVQEGEMEGAREVLTKALALSPDLARAHFFFARVLRAEGELSQAAAHFRRVLAQFPRDRVARNDLGRTLFLMRRYPDAIREFEQTLAIDPEDLTAHYNLMLCYNGLGQEQGAREHERRYLRFKADEASQALTGAYRRAHPEDNNERQPIHEHASAALPRDRARGGSGSR